MLGDVFDHDSARIEGSNPSLTFNICYWFRGSRGTTLVAEIYRIGPRSSWKSHMKAGKKILEKKKKYSSFRVKDDVVVYWTLDSLLKANIGFTCYDSESLD